MGATPSEIKKAVKQALREEADRIKKENTCPICYRDKRPVFYVGSRGMGCIKCWLKYGGSG